jgi:hypothetical protein
MLPQKTTRSVLQACRVGMFLSATALMIIVVIDHQRQVEFHNWLRLRGGSPKRHAQRTGENEYSAPVPFYVMLQDSQAQDL